MAGHAHHGHGGHGHDHGGHGGHGAHAHGGHSHGGHGGHGGHAHAPASYGRAFAIGIGLNTAFVIAEAAFGVVSGSTALVADAGHNLSDVLGLLVAWTASVLSARAPSARYTYGLRGSSILAALANAVLLLVAVGAIAWEAVHRLLEPAPIAEGMVMAVAALGIAINGFTAWLFAGGRKGDINLRGAYLHMVADAAISAGVVVSAFLGGLTGWLWLDPLVALAIAAVIVHGTWGLLAESLAMSLAAVPPAIEPAAVRAFLGGREGVASLHDLHVWPMSTTEIALTAHLVMPEGHPGDAFLARVATELAERFGIGHVTLQVETGAVACALAPDHVV